MRSAITTAAQSIFALFTGSAGARRDRRIESPDDALALFERVVHAKDIFRSAFPASPSDMRVGHYALAAFFSYLRMVPEVRQASG
jgi:hypothetical protein